jgi:hypothetical protein
VPNYQFDFSKPMLVIVAGMFTSSSFSNVKAFVVQIVKSFFLRPRIIGLSSTADFKLIVSYERPDLLRDFDQLVSFLNGKISRVRIVLGSYRPCLIAISDIVIAIREYPHVVQKIEKHLMPSFTQKLITFLAIAEIAKLKRFFEKQIRANDTLIFATEMQFYDNILAQVSRSHCLRSFAFQHGFYHDDGLVIEADNINPVNYLAAVCRTALTWGEFSAIALKKYTSQKLVIIGKPTIIVPPLRAHEMRERQKRNRVLVILDSVKNRKKNIELLDDLTSLPDEVCIIPHPDDQEPYLGKRYRVTSHGDSEYDAVFAINSSAAIQYGLAGYKIYLHPESAIARQLGYESAPNEKYLFGRNYYHSVASSAGAAQNPWEKFIEAHGSECGERLWEALAS